MAFSCSLLLLHSSRIGTALTAEGQKLFSLKYHSLEKTTRFIYSPSMSLNTLSMRHLGCLTGDVLNHLQSQVCCFPRLPGAWSPTTSMLPSHFQIKHVLINLWISLSKSWGFLEEIKIRASPYFEKYLQLVKMKAQSRFRSSRREGRKTL